MPKPPDYDQDKARQARWGERVLFILLAAVALAVVVLAAVLAEFLWTSPQPPQ